MPAMTEPTDHAPAIDLARGIRPTVYGHASSDKIVEPVVEPMWTGVRVIAAAQGETAVLLHDGEEVLDLGVLTSALARAAARTTDGVILDAWVTKQAVNKDAVIYTGTEITASTGKMIAQSMVGVRGNHAEQATARLEADVASRQFADEDVVNLVAIDLLWLDGDWLLDAPLLERRRLLEAVMPGDDLVRAGPYVRPPLQTWIGSWRAQGFPGITFKAANSRYRPGERADDWTTTSMPRR
jgi:ATP dependent DNA ligase domain